MTKQFISKMLKKMCITDKTTWLNLLLKEKHAGTPIESIPIEQLVCNCNYEKTYIFIDSILWNLYGIYYKEYVTTGIGFPMFDPIKWEKAVDKSILYYTQVA